MIIPELRDLALTQRHEGSGDEIDVSPVGPPSGACVIKYDFQTIRPQSTFRVSLSGFTYTASTLF